jgi:hypothetical protein
MSKIAISELFHELGTAEQKTHRGGLDHGFSQDWRSGGPLSSGPKIQKLPTIPIYLGRMVDPDFLASIKSNRADLYGW